MKFLRLLPLLALLSLTTGCSSLYYGAMEKLGHPKRDILVERVEKAQSSQEQAKQQFASALEQFLSITQTDVGGIKAKYDQLKTELELSEDRATEVHRRIDAIDDVAGALFSEWGAELERYSSASLRAKSQRQLEATRKRYDQLMSVMREATAQMEPILANFRDQVLFLKHNLNARALSSLDRNSRMLRSDIARLIEDMEKSIREADDFIRQMAPPSQ